MMVDIRSLDIFVCTCEAGSMTEAARRLNLTQSAVSQQIQQLETLLRTKLFDRALRPLGLTPGGRIVLDVGSKILAEAKGLSAVLAERGGLNLPRLTIGIDEGLSSEIAAKIGQSLSGRVESIAFAGLIGTSSGHKLRQRDIDIAVTLGWQEEADELDQLEFGREGFRVIAPDGLDNFQVTHDLKRITDLGSHIRLAPQSTLGRELQRHFRRHGVDPRVAIDVERTDMALELVAAGLGWAILPERGLVALPAGCRDCGPLRGFHAPMMLVARKGELSGMLSLIRNALSPGAEATHWAPFVHPVAVPNGELVAV